MLDRHPGKEHGRQWNGPCNKHTRYNMKPDKNESCLPCVAEKKTTRPSKRKTDWLGLGLPSSDGTPGDTRVRLWEAGLVSAHINVDSRW